MLTALETIDVTTLPATVPEIMVDAHKNFNGLLDLTMPLFWVVYHPWLVLATIDLPTKFEVFISIH